jgi:uncharacterized DUF497 family protein
MVFNYEFNYDFDWDDKKASISFAKHKVSFDEGKTIFKDPFLITYPDELHSDNEDRLISIGKSIGERLLLVVHLEKLGTVNSVLIRIISCRKATPSERKRYEEGEQ